MTDVALFLGPTLPEAEAAALLPARHLPPARQGDVYRLVRDSRPDVIGIVDGHFLQTPAVWHREILFALSEGVHVFGAASMGALRAAELHGFGMVGVGDVYHAYRNNAFPPFDGPFERDDEVAIEHGPAEAGYPAVTDALVDMRATFAKAMREGVLDRVAAHALLDAATRINFRDRSYAAAIEAAGAGSVAFDRARLQAWLTTNALSQKAADARAMLAAIKALGAKVAPFAPSFRFERSLAWERFRAACDAADAATLDEIGEETLDELRLDPSAYGRVAERARLAHAATGGRSPSEDDAMRGLKRLRARHALHRRADLDAWMRANALDVDDLRRLASRAAMLASLPDPPSRALLDEARDAGLAPALSARAQEKRGVLKESEAARRAPGALERSALVAWWYETALGRQEPADLKEAARSLGFADEERLVRALWRERLYRRHLDGAG